MAFLDELQLISISTPNSGNGDNAYVGGGKLNGNFTAIAEAVDTINAQLDNVLIEKPISFLGLNPAFNRRAKAAAAINALTTFSITSVQSFWFSRIFTTGLDVDVPGGGVNVGFIKEWYYIKGKGKGTYGAGGVQLLNSDIVVGHIETSSAGVITLGAIGIAEVWDFMTANGPYIVAGVTEVRATQDAVEKRWLFIGPNDTYGTGATAVTANNFLEITAEGEIIINNTDLAPEIYTGTALALEVSMLNRLVQLPGNGVTLTLNEATVEQAYEDGIFSIKTRVEFLGTGTHTVIAPDATAHTFAQGALVYIERRKNDSDGWIVKQWEGGSGGGQSNATAIDSYNINETSLGYNASNACFNETTLYAGIGEQLVKIEDGVQTVLLDIEGTTEWRCVFLHSSGSVFASPLNSGPILDFPNFPDPLDYALYKYDGNTVTKVLQLPVRDSVWGIDEDSNGHIYAFVYGLGTVDNAKGYKSTDNGDTWTEVFDGDGWRHNHVVFVDRSNDYVYILNGDAPLGGSKNYRSIDGGVTWTTLSNTVQHTGGIAVDGARLFGTDQSGLGRIYRTTNDVDFDIVLDTHYQNCFFIRQSDVTGWVYAGFKTDPSASTNLRADIYISKDLGVTWILFKTIANLTAGEGFWFASNFFRGKLIITMKRDGFQDAIFIQETTESIGYNGTTEVAASRQITEFDNNRILNVLEDSTLTLPSTGLQEKFKTEIDVINGYAQITDDGLGVVIDNVSPLQIDNKVTSILYRKNLNNYRLKSFMPISIPPPPDLGVLFGVEGFIHAYSHRRLKTSYLGNAIRVRRSSDNTLKAIGFFTGELNETSLTDFIGAGNGFEETFYDQVGSRNLIQATNANQPQIVSSGAVVKVSGKPYANYDNSNDFLATPSTATPITDKDCTVFVVFESQAGTSAQTVFQEYRASNDSVYMLSDTRTTVFSHSNYRADGTVRQLNFSSQQPQSTKRIFILRKSGDDVEAYDENNTLIATINSSAVFSADTILELGRALSGSLYFGGKIAELLINNTALSTTDRNLVLDNIKDFYSIV